MSHMVASSVIITDLECLKRVLSKYPKLKWREGQTKFKWYGKWMNDYDRDDAAYKLGIDPEDYGHCEHAIRMDGVDYEIGIMKRKDGQGYSLAWDFFADGSRISDYIGKGAEKLMVEYSRAMVEQHATQEGMMLSQTEDQEYIYMTLEQP